MKSEKNVGARIRSLRKGKNLTLKAFAERIGVSLPYLGAVERGEKAANSIIFFGIRREFGVDLTDLAAEDGSVLTQIARGVLPARQIPVLGRISAGFPDIVAEEVTGYISMPSAPSNSFALIVRGDSMEPSIKDGDHVIFIENGAYYPGDVLVVLNEWGEASMKRLKEKEGEKYLVPDNTSYPALTPNEHYRIIGKVVKVWRDVRF